MSVHIISFKDGAKMMRPVLTETEYRNLRNSAKQKRTLKAVRDGDESQKTKLVQMNYSCLPNEDGSLKGSKRMSSAVGLDVDHIKAEEMEAVKERILAKAAELGLLMLELSARGKGYHLVFKRRPELSQEENLKWASELLGVQYDEGAKDITRVFFTTTASAEDLIYLDEELFKIEEIFDQQPSSPSMEITSVTPTIEGGGSGGGSAVFPTEYHGFTFEKILKKYWELHNRGYEPKMGDRDTLTYQLACDLRHICGNNFEWLDQVIPCYDNFPLEEKRAKIRSAIASKYESMPYRLKQTLAALKSDAAVRACGGTLTAPPPMPKKLPPLVKLLTKNVPWFYRPAVASAVFPALGVHLHGVKFRYWDNVEHEATFMNVLIGRQSIGKGTIKKPIEYIMEDIKQRDIPNRQREAEWKQKNPSRRKTRGRRTSVSRC